MPGLIVFDLRRFGDPDFVQVGGLRLILSSVESTSDEMATSLTERQPQETTSRRCECD